MKKYLAFDIGGTSIKYGIVTTSGKVRFKAEMPSEIHLGGQALMGKLLDITGRLHSEYTLSGVGICTPGVVDVKVKRVIAGANHIFDWYNIDQCSIIEAQAGLPCIIENDAKSAALGEKWVGGGQPYETFYMVTFGTGLGGALFINGQLYRGVNFVAGEISSLYSTFVDPIRSATAKGLVYMARECFDDSDMDGRKLFQGIREGNSEYDALLSEWCSRAVLPLCDIFCVVDPEALVIGGGISGAADIFLPRLKSAMYKRLETELQNIHINVVPAELGNDAGMIGAIYPFTHQKNHK